MLDKKKGKLTIFFGYDNTLLSTMIFQGLKKMMKDIKFTLDV